MFPKGAVIQSPKWNEPVEVISLIEEPGIGYLAQVKGRKSNRLYEDYILEEELAQLELAASVSELDDMTVADMLYYYFLKHDIYFADQQARGNGQVIPLPHQIEAVYSRMLKTPTVRYLLADDPGAGKTIMSGMLVSEMMARGEARRILVLVPPLVQIQWQQELKGKFGDDFTIINRALLNTLGGNPFEQYEKIICSIYWAMRDDIKALILSSSFDLVIVDEAHKMAAYTEVKQKKKQTRRTKLYRLGEELSRKTEHLLLLTATPHKGDHENFRHLLRLLDEDLFHENIPKGDMQYTAKPYVIRRLKESMIQFDGTPLFPNRTTKTLTFDLSVAETELYEEVTNYVSEHFNRAKRRGNRSTSFAMMLLQRRLSSSIEAIYLSLLRRRERLSVIEKEELKKMEEEVLFFDEITPDELDQLEDNIIGAVAEYDHEELRLEIEQLDRLIELTEQIREDNVEYKYDELERTLFGKGGLLANGEKLLVFTESKDTLRYLERRLKERLTEVAIIEGSMNMNQRQQSVRKFREEVPVMIATDAGGESINLQFCNQMINYDIPWNPNKLEQRMGRIHRIGQKNEVFVFNLVAVNTREGVVMQRLLDKLNTMREDLGSELVYDFLGDILEEYDLSLERLMMESIENREHLDEIIAQMERILSEEHARLIQLAKKESVTDKVDLPGVRKTFNDVRLRVLPQRAYTKFLKRELEKQRINVTERTKKIFRISYLPKVVLQKAKTLGLHFNKFEELIFTMDRQLASEDVTLVSAGHPLVTLLISEVEEQRFSSKLTTYSVDLPAPEKLEVAIISYKLRDGNNRILSNELKIVALRETGKVVELSPYWLYQLDEPRFEPITGESTRVLTKAKRLAILNQNEVRNTRSLRAMQKEEQLRKAFDARIANLQIRLDEFIRTNEKQKNSANINKFKSQIREQEQRRHKRIEHVRREGAISLQKIEIVTQLYVEADDESWRCFPTDVRPTIELYEEEKGRKPRMLPAMGLVDFVSESEDKQRFIVVANSVPSHIPNIHDYDEIINQTYIYVIDGYLISQVVPLEHWRI